jgi:hypothetical protein
MLAQETRQRSGRHRPEQSASPFVASGAVSGKDLRSRLARFEILRACAIRRETDDHKHHRRQTERSAQHSILRGAETAAAAAVHLLAHCIANGSAQMTQPRDHNSGYPPCGLCIGGTVPSILSF